MPSTVQPILMTPQLDRLLAFYRDVFDAKDATRMPPEGPAFYLGLVIGDTDVGLVADEKVVAGEPSRFILSIAVEDADAVLATVEPAGGVVLGSPNDMPWGQRVAHIQDPDGNLVNITQDL
jgi:predicted enzyme related to lactoylglutathione lyase